MYDINQRHKELGFLIYVRIYLLFNYQYLRHIGLLNLLLDGQQGE